MEIRAPGLTRTTLVGVYDHLTRSHVDQVRDAASRGPVDVVVLSDCLAHRTCGAKPTTPECARVEIVANLRGVDTVLLVEAPEVLAEIVTVRARAGQVIQAEGSVGTLPPRVLDLRDREPAGHQVGRS